MSNLPNPQPASAPARKSGWQQSLKVRAGRFKPTKGKSILICTGALPSQWVQEFLRAFSEINPRENVFFLVAERSDNCEIANGARLPYPLQIFGFTGRYLRKLRAGIVVVDEGARPPRRLLDSARADNIAVVHVGSAQTPLRTESEIHGLGREKSSTAARRLSPLMAIEREPFVKLKKRARYFVWKHLLYRFHRQRLQQMSSLREIYRALGQPRSILCLGNGPSSEDPAIAEGDYDAVFRVNHRWLDRTHYTRPDAVFTGAVESVIKVGTDSLYVFIDPDRAMRMVMRAQKEVPRLSFANARELGFPLHDFAPYQPTNGLIMVYMAVKLDPPVLTIGGIDLFADPRGAYPDETETPNHYTSAHNEAMEVEFLLQLLASYRGDLRIVGDKLASKYEAYTGE